MSASSRLPPLGVRCWRSCCRDQQLPLVEGWRTGRGPESLHCEHEALGLAQKVWPAKFVRLYPAILWLPVLLRANQSTKGNGKLRVVGWRSAEYTIRSVTASAMQLELAWAETEIYYRDGDM